MRTKDMVFGYYKEYYDAYDLSMPIRLHIADYPHMLITGSSGSGKSYALLFLIGKLLQSYPDIVLYICDFKNSEEFSFMAGYIYYYSGKDCYNGIMDYYNRFSELREQGRNEVRYLLIADEYPAFINYLQMLDKASKTRCANDILGAISEILMLGRGIKFGIWIVTQRADSSLFYNGARDNFMIVLGLGKMSKEQKTMIFTGQEMPDTIFSAGEGMLLADGKEIICVKYPLIKDMDNWKKHILERLYNNHI